jgi:ribonucleoside-triphosphate reductase (formate)
MDYSLQGLNNYLSTRIISDYWIRKIYPPEIRDVHYKRQLHIHDLSTLGPYCVGWDLEQLLLTGFRGAPGKIVCSPPKHFSTALGQIVNFIYTLQGEAAGAQAFSNFDTLLAPFIYYDKLSEEDVKKELEKFMFNMNVPTRVGFQCLSEDTEILTNNGWKKHNTITYKDKVASFNINKKIIEYLKINNIFSRKYSGTMYSLKNKNLDQLISPKHRVVRKLHSNTNNYILQPIEDVLKDTKNIIIPKNTLGNINGKSLDNNLIKLVAWIISKDNVDKNERITGKITLYQSKIKNIKNYKIILKLLNYFKLKYTITDQKGLGNNFKAIRLDSNSSKFIYKIFKSNKNKGIKFIPSEFLNLNTKCSKLFLETYRLGDKEENRFRITTTSNLLKDQLMQISFNAGFTSNYKIIKAKDISKKDKFVINILKGKNTSITKIKKLNYKGYIWCVNSKNETLIARRNKKCFITGNTPFSNITLDLTIPSTFKDKAVIIGGEPKEKTYNDFSKELELFNKCLLEVYENGDANKAVFTFPIPTVNITKDFNWNSSLANQVLEITSKYGTPSFCNYVNSDLNPEDARSMCCRLRLDNRELHKRGGGGLFGSSPLTGSIGVVTINMPQLAYLSKDENDFFIRLAHLMDMAKNSLEIKRKIIEKYTDDGLYPYSKYCLKEIKKRNNSYWQNHFSTIGLLGMNEAVLNLLNCNITTKKGQEFTLKTLDFMRERILRYQEESGNLFNLEATPGEGTTYKFAKYDKEHYPDIIVANEEEYRAGAEPYYTNSTQLPVGFSDDIFEVLDLQDEIQCKYTGGTILHIFIGEKRPNKESIKLLIQKICNNYQLPYFTISPTFSICPKHGYIFGEHKYCPICDKEINYEKELEKIEQTEEKSKLQEKEHEIN